MLLNSYSNKSLSVTKAFYKYKILYIQNISILDKFNIRLFLKLLINLNVYFIPQNWLSLKPLCLERVPHYKTPERYKI